MNVKIFGKNVLNIMLFFVVLLFNVHNVQKVNYYHMVHHFDIMVEHKKKLLNMHVKIILKIDHLLGKENLQNPIYYVWFLFFRSYSNTRTVAPITNRSHRSPGSTIKASDTTESVRHR